MSWFLYSIITFRPFFDVWFDIFYLFQNPIPLLQTKQALLIETEKAQNESKRNANIISEYKQVGFVIRISFVRMWNKIFWKLCEIFSV